MVAKISHSCGDIHCITYHVLHTQNEWYDGVPLRDFEKHIINIRAEPTTSCFRRFRKREFGYTREHSQHVTKIIFGVQNQNKIKASSCCAVPASEYGN